MAARKKTRILKATTPMLQAGTPNAGAQEKTVMALQKALLRKGFNPGKIDGVFGLGTQAAVMAFQQSEGLLADGVVGPRTIATLNDTPPQSLPNILDRISPAVVSQMFPHTPLGCWR